MKNKNTYQMCMAILLSLVYTSCFHTRAIVDYSVANFKLSRMQASDYFNDPVQAKFVNAVGRGDELQMAKLLKQGADPNALGKEQIRPIFWALGKRSKKGLVFLLKNGADPNVKIVNQSDIRGNSSAMELAVIADDIDYLRILLDHGGNPDTLDETRTIISKAILHRKNDHIRILVNAGANINHRDISGSTPVIIAAGVKNFQVVYYLLQAGANPKIKDRWGNDLAGVIRLFGDRGIKKGSEQYDWYLKVLDKLNMQAS